MRNSKILSLFLAILMVLSLFTLTACESGSPAKIGLSAIFDSTPNDATEEADGNVTHNGIFAAVLVDNEGKIISCDIDEMEILLPFDIEGYCVAAEAFITKRELGDNYGMNAYAGTTEWYAQIDALEKVIIGKNSYDLYDLLNGEGYGNDDVATAGCTIYIEDYIAAVVYAADNAKESKATSNDTVAVAAVASVSTTDDATEEASGKIEADVAFAAVAKNKDGKITASLNDAATVDAVFDMEGYAEMPGIVLTKRELGDDYGMQAYAGTNEWYVQADALDAYVIGKTADEVLAAMDANGVPNADVAKAGCTINIYAAVTAINKAAK